MDEFKSALDDGSSWQNTIDKPWPIAMRYGLIGAAVFALYLIILGLMGSFNPEVIRNMDPETMQSTVQPAGGIISSLLPLILLVAYIFIYFSAVKTYRTQLGGSISFGKGFKVSFYSVLIKALAAALFTFLYFSFAASGFLDAMIDFSMNIAASQDTMGDDELEMLQSIYSFMISPGGAAVFALFWTFIGGAILSIVAAAIGQKD